MRSLHWLIPELPSQDLGELKHVSLASIRLRCVPSMIAAQKLGWSVSCGEIIPSHVSVVMIGKIGSQQISTRKSLWLDQLTKLNNMSKIFLDYTDNHLGFDSKMSDFYRAAVPLTDMCIVPTNSMASLLSSEWHGPTYCIQDPVEVPIQPVKSGFNKPIVLLWFGHPSNIQFLIDFLKNGFSFGDEVRLIILSDDVGLNYFANTKIVSNAQIQVQLALWSIQAMSEAAKFADICIIPSDLSNPRKLGASPNRLITALGLGLPVAADNLPSYKEFEGYYCDLRGDGFKEMLKNPTKFSSMVTQAQADIMPRFSMSQIEDDWRTFFQFDTIN